jgi:rubrerythrin
MTTFELHASEERIAPDVLSRFRCAQCGYGASRRIAPERCPLCSGTVWEYERSQPFGSFLRDLDPRAEP